MIYDKLENIIEYVKFKGFADAMVFLREFAVGKECGVYEVRGKDVIANIIIPHICVIYTVECLFSISLSLKDNTCTICKPLSAMLLPCMAISWIMILSLILSSCEIRVEEIKICNLKFESEYCFFE